MKKITIPYPDDWHCHLRDHSCLKRTVTDTAKRFARAIIMPNLVPPITSVTQAQQYRNRILAETPQHTQFEPLMTLYLTTTLAPTEIHQGKLNGIITACKLYPAGATTHSDAGVKQLETIYPLLEAMQVNDMPLLIHGEVTDPHINVLEREARFIEDRLIPLIDKFPNLRIVLEHISTKQAVDFILSQGPNLAATITPHHLLLNLNDMLDHGIRPHYYCKPVVKQLEDQAALIKAAISGNHKFFLGTDSAPHKKGDKECSSGCAGVYSAHAAIELYAEVFSQHQALDKLADFASRFGANFYKLPVNSQTLTLVQRPWQVPTTLEFGNDTLVPLMSGQILNWALDKDA